MTIINNELNQRFQQDQLLGVRSAGLSAEAANARTLSLQFFSNNQEDMAVAVAVQGYLSSDKDGLVLEPESATLTVAGGTDGQVQPFSAVNVLGHTTFMAISEKDGDLDIKITQTSGADTHYVNIVLPDGSVWTSEAIVFV